MRRFGVLLVMIGLLAAAPPVIAQDGLEPHPHMLLQRPVVDVIEVEGEPVLALVGFRKCVDLAANKPVPLHAHHEHLHFGDSGVSFGGASGHVVVPTAPFPAPFDDPVPWSNCAEFATFLPLPIPEGE